MDGSQACTLAIDRTIATLKHIELPPMDQIADAAIFRSLRQAKRCAK